MGNEAAEIRRQRKAAALAAAQQAQQSVHGDFNYARTQIGDALFLQIAQANGATIDSSGTVNFRLDKGEPTAMEFLIKLLELLNQTNHPQPREPREFHESAIRGLREWERRMNEYQSL